MKSKCIFFLNCIHIVISVDNLIFFFYFLWIASLKREHNREQEKVGRQSKKNKKLNPELIHDDKPAETICQFWKKSHHHQRLINRWTWDKGWFASLRISVITPRQEQNVSTSAANRVFEAHGHGITAGTSCPGCLPYNNSAVLHHCIVGTRG